VSGGWLGATNVGCEEPALRLRSRRSAGLWGEGRRRSKGAERVSRACCRSSASSRRRVDGRAKRRALAPEDRSSMDGANRWLN
jgi:hypothetical protein